MILKRLKIETMIGNYTNCYILADEEQKQGMCIDPAGEPEKIVETLNLLGVDLKYIYLTHCHADHTAGLDELKRQTNAKVLIHRLGYENLQNQDINLSQLIGVKNVETEADARVDDKDKIHIGNIELEVMHTPGHTNRWNIALLKRAQSIIFRRYNIQRNLWKMRSPNAVQKKTY